MSIKLLIVLFCSISLVLGESQPDPAEANEPSDGIRQKPNEEQQTTTKETQQGPNYAQLIENLQNEVNTIKSDEIPELISAHKTQLQALDNTQKTLDAIKQSFEQQHANLQQSVESVLHSNDDAVEILRKRADKAADVLSKHNRQIDTFTKTLRTLSEGIDTLESSQTTQILNEMVNTLSARIASVENAQSDKEELSDTSSVGIQDLDSRVAKLSSSMTREITDNTKRLEMIEEGLNDTEMDDIKRSIKQLTQRLQKAQERNDESFRMIKERFDGIEESISKTNQNVQTVYDSTLGAVIDKILSKSLDYLADFGEYLVNIMDSLKRKISEIEWKAYMDGGKAWVMRTLNIIIDKISDIDWRAQYILFREWLYGVYEYIQFWWMEGIQPAIIRQATNLYFGIQRVTRESVSFIHSHALYHEMMSQLSPYLLMGNIPEEYNGYIVDGVLTLFGLSSLVTLSFLLGFCCDCCCPRKALEITEPGHANQVRRPNKSIRKRKTSRKN